MANITNNLKTSPDTRYSTRYRLSVVQLLGSSRQEPCWKVPCLYEIKPQSIRELIFLLGFGVGDEKASSTNAVLLSVVQDATGRLASTFLIAPLAWKTACC